MSIRCLIFKVLCALRVSVRAFLLYHARFALSSTFSDFFKIFFVFDRSAFATAILLYHIELALSRTFFIFFQDFFVPASLRSPSRASSFPSIGRLSAAFFAPSLCDSFTILPHLSPFVKLFLTEFLCLLIVLYLSYPLLTIGTNIILLFSTAITTGILFTLRYYNLCNGIPCIY